MPTKNDDQHDVENTPVEAASLTEVAETLNIRNTELRKRGNSIVNLAIEENRDPTADETALMAELHTEIEANTTRIEVILKQDEINRAAIAPVARKTQPEPVRTVPAAPKASPMQSLVASQGMTGTGGFANLGAFAKAVQHEAMTRGADRHPRLVAVAQESVGADGGFLVPTDFSDMIIDVMFGDSWGSLAARCFQLPLMSNNITIPLDMTTPAAGGVRAYWEGERNRHTESDLDVEQITLRAHKLTSMVVATEELLEDAGATGALIMKAAAESLNWEVANAIVNGSGSQQPRGILNSSAVIQVAADSGQSADTISTTNVANMWAGLPPECKMRAIWLIAPSAVPQLENMSIADQPVFMPAGGKSELPYATLYGRPIVEHVACQAVGDRGDIILADMSQYIWASKRTGIRSATSMHLHFDTDMMAFKFQIRADGLVSWSKAITVPYGSHQLAPFVVLANRT